MRRPAFRAFTLVELIATLAITTLIMGATVAIVRGAVHARRDIEARLEGELEAARAADAVVTALRNAYRPIDADDARFVGVDDAAGELPADRVSFRTLSRRSLRRDEAESDVRDVEFFVERPDTAKPAVLLRRTDPTRNEPPDNGGVVETLATNVSGLGITYFDGLIWADEWPESKRWPRAVRLEILYVADTRSGELGRVTRLVGFPHWRPSTDAGAAPPAGRVP
jgi:type II secretory pathway pseudopilin PulG